MFGENMTDFILKEYMNLCIKYRSKIKESTQQS